MTDTKKVLIVEDDEYISKVYEIKFAKEGINISLARDGEEAVKMITEIVPDLILLDLMIPKKDGFAVLEEIKKKPKLAAIPVIVLSNLGQISDVERAKKLGANEFLIKVDHPIQDVINKVNGYLKISS